MARNGFDETTHLTMADHNDNEVNETPVKSYIYNIYNAFLCPCPCPVPPSFLKAGDYS